MSDGTITVKKETLWMFSTFILAAVLIIGAFVFFLNNNSTGTGNVVNNPAQQVPGSTESATVDDDAVLGDKNAPVTIIEFSDYECPFCGRHFTQTHPQIVRDYVNTGKVKIVFRDFPLSFHPNAQSAAEAAECVREKGGDEAYFKMHDKLFENQQSLSTANYNTWAKELGYDISSCLSSGKFRSEVQKDFADGQAAGVQGTPSFFIDGNLVVGAQPYEAIKQAIDAALAN